jgi:glycosyltransferase involved in cell wall biosynthesis
MGNGRVTAWGGYDRGKPRVRLLLEALARRGALTATVNIDVWKGVEDKSVAGPLRLVAAMVRLIFAYPIAIVRLLRTPSDAAVLLPYPAIPDIFVVALPAKLRRQTIVFDAFIPVHDTIVRDRGLLPESSLRARIIWAVEWLALRLADIVLVDTDEHGAFLAREFGLSRERIITVLVGAEPQFGAPVSPFEGPSLPSDRPIVLFYGQLIPLHGLTTILEACAMTKNDRLHWVVVGKGQMEPVLRAALEGTDQSNITWIPWVDYEKLPALIARSTLCLGIFGESDKAARVIPNKVFQALACGKPVVTRASPAVASLAERYPATIVTVPANDPVALVTAIRNGLCEASALRPLPVEVRAELGPDPGVERLLRCLSEENAA